MFMNTMTTQEIAAAYEAARQAIYTAECNNMSERTIAKKYKTLFKFEDELKARGAM